MWGVVIQYRWPDQGFAQFRFHYGNDFVKWEASATALLNGVDVQENSKDSYTGLSFQMNWNEIMVRFVELPYRLAQELEVFLILKRYCTWYGH